MPLTLKLSLSEAAIKRHAEDPAVRELKDQRHPLALRYRQDRTRASWYLLHRGSWHKLGNWPELKLPAVLQAYPERLARLAVDPAASTVVDGWQTLAPLLTWYRDRMHRDRNLSQKRKATVASVIDRHLLPRLGEVTLAGLDRPTLDQRLFWPLQEVYSVAYCRQVYAVLKSASKTAQRLQMIDADPVASLVFTDFITTSIKPKTGRLQAEHVAGLLQDWAGLFDQHPEQVAIAVLMLAHGTRIGETRMARWEHIHWRSRIWFIPAEHTKTGAAHELPLTPQMLAFLERYRQHQPAGAFLFGSGKPLGARSASHGFKTLIKEGEWTSHDLRKLARTGWADLGVDYLVGELLLNHALKDLDAAYIHTHAATLKRDALSRWHNWLDGQGLDRLTRSHTETEPRQAANGTAAQAAPLLAAMPFPASITKEEARP